jgi:DNA mismatch endonuclease (patch repair protein)
MSRIAGKNTKPELTVRRGLFAKGFRFRLHSAKLPGKPDLVFPKYRAVVFVNGCFWHSHNCRFFRQPGTNAAFWNNKLKQNADNDARAIAALKSSGWRVLTIWECALRGANDRTLAELLGNIAEWLASDDDSGSFCGA